MSISFSRNSASYWPSPRLRTTPQVHDRTSQARLGHGLGVDALQPELVEFVQRRKQRRCGRTQVTAGCEHAHRGIAVERSLERKQSGCVPFGERNVRCVDEP